MKLFKSISIVSLNTLFSRVTGYIRDMVFAFVLGANNITDAYYLSFMIPNFFRRLLAEGALSVSIIPVYSEEINKSSFEEANKKTQANFALPPGLVHSLFFCFRLNP